MKKIVIAQKSDIDNIAVLRTEQQVEDWEKTLGVSFRDKADRFYELTKNHLNAKLNDSLFFYLMYIDEIPVAMCALEELEELPQITVCNEKTGRHGWIVSVFTRPEHRGCGYQQELMKVLLEFAGDKGFSNITLTANTPDAKHIYKKLGFEYISDKYLLNL